MFISHTRRFESDSQLDQHAQVHESQIQVFPEVSVDAKICQTSFYDGLSPHACARTPGRHLSLLDSSWFALCLRFHRTLRIAPILILRTESLSLAMRTI